MDKTDQKILAILHRNARVTNPELADKVGLSTSPCWSRVRRLEKEGVIQQYVTVINQEKIGLPDTAIIEIMFERHDATIFSDFEKTIAAMPEVIEAYMLTGEYDCFMKVAVAGTKGYEDFLVHKLYKIRGIKNTRSSLTLRCFKQVYSPIP
ncbi:MAG: Lrp/AsnC family transcriptional regulator [Cellvibrionaceae bacterium]